MCPKVKPRGHLFTFLFTFSSSQHVGRGREEGFELLCCGLGWRRYAGLRNTLVEVVVATRAVFRTGPPLSLSLSLCCLSSLSLCCLSSLSLSLYLLSFFALLGEKVKV